MKLLFKLTQQQTLSRCIPFFICGKNPISVKLGKLGTLLLTASSLWSPQIKRIDLCLPLMPDCEFESSAFIGDRDYPSTDCFGSRRTNSRRKQDEVTCLLSPSIHTLINCNVKSHQILTQFSER